MAAAWRYRCVFYLQLLYGLAVLLLSAQLSHLDQDGPGLARVLGLQARRQLPALLRLMGDGDTGVTRSPGLPSRYGNIVTRLTLLPQ